MTFDDLIAAFSLVCLGIGFAMSLGVLAVAVARLLRGRGSDD